MKIFTNIIFFIIFFSVCTDQHLSASEKIKIGLLVPLSGENADVGNSIVKSVKLAISKINNDQIEIFPKDTENNPATTLKVAKDLNDMGIKIVIGPIFNKNLIYLDELKDMTFLSLTNKTLEIPKNVISVGINSLSQISAIIKFQELEGLKKTIFLIPESHYEDEIKKSIKEKKIKIKNTYIYNSDPTKLTKQIEKITKYKTRQLDLKRKIKKLTNSNDPNKEKKLEKLEKMDTIGGVNFDSIIIADFDESLKSITTSLLYVDVRPKEIFFITLNQWFDSSLLKEKSSQPLYFPSINYENYKKFSENYYSQFDEYPNQLSIISYDLVGLIYYLILQNDFIVDEELFVKKNKFKGKIGFFEIKKNRINHILNFYKIEDSQFKKIF
ncbi:ABC transporter substrate-binding protein [Candidatus Pelagibacter sp.]|jgi:ABC-type branched-subunit amino acid transport system substrate-binding protein|nr:ABC transporter substrate-binding protein [Candidatus Pelagibacter sp.]